MPPSQIDAELTFLDPAGSEVKLSSFRGRPLLLIFLRHLV
jgi:hypothetical protein